jgi:RNA polymerase sigma-70 factor (ECF subfamily)
MTDEQILDILNRKKDTEYGFRLLMDKYQHKLYQHIRRMVINHEDANDVLQNTFIKVYRHIGKFEGKSSLYTWIYRIATNESLTHLKRTSRMSLVTGAEDDVFTERLESNDGPSTETLDEMLMEALKLLPDKQKSVFSLRYFEEMTYKELSQVLQTSEGALKASYHHAVKKIENYFKTINIY